MLDFYADWCVSCIEMEEYTFTDAGVQAALSNTVLLQADVTENDEADQELCSASGSLDHRRLFSLARMASNATATKSLAT